MSIVKSEDNKKWINSFVAIVSIIIGYMVIRFSLQMGEWFDLEAKINYFQGIAQGIGIVVGLVSFILVVKNEKASTHMQEVYEELIKVIWPDSNSVVKVTVGIVIGLVILSGIFVSVDFLFGKLLDLIY